MFHDSAFQTSAGFSYVSRTAVFGGAGPLVHHIPACCVGILSLGCISKVYSVLYPLKIIWTLVFLKILLNTSLSPCMYGILCYTIIELTLIGLKQPLVPSQSQTREARHADPAYKCRQAIPACSYPITGHGG